MKTFSMTDVGRIREVNQDYVHICMTPLGSLPNLFVVADGMGGHKAGDFASKYTVEVLEEVIDSSEEQTPEGILQEAGKEANRRLIEAAGKDIKLEGMGTTLVAATIIDNMLHFLNVGDSRLYLINNEIRQLSKDHSLVEEMVRLGGIKEEEAQHHPDKNIITRAVGVNKNLEADYYEHILQKGDVILMCTDGLSNMIDNDEIFRIVKSARDVVEAVEQLIQAANEKGGRDNIGVVIVQPYEEEVSI
ncbi:Stp1/IreP family PP2C-type Ser/Thr phosphatase [Lachnospiraceae bacterium OttesenSCG-928-E19]|nr:Stp1/IreP family PP2C-type Ser/Thr phosphatase [Lachnospiraceae bacterium OttesenSCG-928-E19]